MEKRINLDYKLITSNENKLEEFKKIGFDFIIEKGKDLKEIDCDNPINVILHKSIDSGKGFIVEDTSLEIEGLNFGTNIRWMLNDLKFLENKKAEWIVLLGVNDGKYIHIYKGSIEGTIINVENIPTDNFGFDCYFVPKNETKSLYELKKTSNDFSARKNALLNFKNDICIKRILIKNNY